MITKRLVLMVAAALLVPACKKSGGGGGGGGWFVGDDGLMRQVQAGTVGETYDLGASETLHGIACRGRGEAFVVGAHGTLLVTDDGGESWAAEELPTTADLRAVATQDGGPVFVVGDGVFAVGTQAGAEGIVWTMRGERGTRFRSVAAAQRATTVLALDEEGGIWSYQAGQLVAQGRIPGARAVAVSPDGRTALVAGDGLQRSMDGGVTWARLPTNPGSVFEDSAVDDAGAGLAVGAAGLVALVDSEGRVLHQRVGTADLHTMHVGGWSATARDGYAAGDGGATWITRDGGWSWSAGPNLGANVRGVDEIGVAHR